MKKLLLSVVCANSEACERSESFCVELTEKDIKRIKALSGVIEVANVYSVDEFYYRGEWSDMFIESPDIEADHSNLDDVIELMQEAKSNVDVPMMRVTKDNFYFTALPKHCGDALALSTARVPLSELDDQRVFIHLD